MRGAGIRLAITVSRPFPARLLDLSRLTSRVGRVPTGIDRVEIAYLKAFLADSVPVFGLVKTAWGYILLDQAGCQGLSDRIDGVAAWGPVDRLSRLRKGLPLARQRAEADLRRMAIARALPIGLQRMLRRNLPKGISYVNVGHTNLSRRVLAAISSSLYGRVSVMIHDTIPLDFPHFQRDGTVESFRAMLSRVQTEAHLILCNSTQTERDVIRHLSPTASRPKTLVAHLGVSVSEFNADPIWPKGFDKNRPYFVTTGTIEPRKNHQFLLDIWQQMQEQETDIPQLLICGARGWKNEALFARLEIDPIMGRHVFEMTGLSDEQIAALTKQSQGALFPSHAEGFGLPPVEALALGVPVICNDLEIYREIIGDYPVYASVADSYLWRKEIRKLAENRFDRQRTSSQFKAPNWDAHFNRVLSHL